MIMPSSSAVLPPCELMRACSASTSFPSQSGYLLVTTGILAKLYSGGGLGMVHSRVPAPHGFGPAISPCFLLRKKLYTKKRVAIGQMNAPTDDIPLYMSQPWPESYV